MSHPPYRFFCALLSLLTLAACGFSPLYGDHTGGPTGANNPQAKLQSIYIGNIADREGQVLRNDLIDRLYTQGQPEGAPYYLTIDPLETHITDQAISVTSDATRAELRITTRMTLQDRKSGCVLLRRDLLTVNSYNILSSEFTSLVSRQAVLEDELNDLAQQVETQLSLYFARTPDPQATLASALHAPAVRPLRSKGMPTVPPGPTGAAPICPALPGAIPTMQTGAIDALLPEAQNLPARNNPAKADQQNATGANTGTQNLSAVPPTVPTTHAGASP